MKALTTYKAVLAGLIAWLVLLLISTTTQTVEEDWVDALTNAVLVSRGDEGDHNGFRTDSDMNLTWGRSKSCGLNGNGGMTSPRTTP